jgi:hypothetical protein
MVRGGSASPEGMGAYSWKTWHWRREILRGQMFQENLEVRRGAF